MSPAAVALLLEEHTKLVGLPCFAFLEAAAPPTLLSLLIFLGKGTVVDEAGLERPLIGVDSAGAPLAHTGLVAVLVFGPHVANKDALVVHKAVVLVWHWRRLA